MTLSFTQLKNGTVVVLEPVPVSITGLPDTLLIHQFSMTQMQAVLDKEADNPDIDRNIVVGNQLLKFLNGFDYEPTEEDRELLKSIFSQAQIREIYSKALTLNGRGVEALREAEKN